MNGHPRPAPLGVVGASPVRIVDLSPGDRVLYAPGVWRVVALRGEVHQHRWTLVIRPASLPWEPDDDPADVCVELDPYQQILRLADTVQDPVCAHCGGHWPCDQLPPEQRPGRDADRAARFARRDVCPACGELVDFTMVRQTWPINLYGPDPTSEVCFHLRDRCLDAAIRYDQDVLAAGHLTRLGFR